MDTPLGHNKPPSQVAFAEETATAVGDWLKENPVIQTEEQARNYKLLRDRGKLCLKDMEDERKGRVRPLQEQEKAINDEYRSSRTILEKILGEGDDRLNAWIKKEEEKRLRAAEEARKKAEEAERIAREAEAREHEAKDDARHGVIGDENDVALRTREADTAFTSYKTAEREAARAEKAIDVRIGGGFTRSLSARFKEELVVDNPLLAVSVMGWSERLLSALLTDAREWRREYGYLPKGIIAKTDRRL